MSIAPHIARLRAFVGHEILLLPAVSVLPIDAYGRVLIVRPEGHDGWGILGGAVDVDESPAQAAVRECREEIGVHVQLGRMLGAFGGPEYRMEYPNGDLAAYVVTVFQASLAGAISMPDGKEIVEAGWFLPDELQRMPLLGMTRAILRDSGYLK
jgi:ADP-ribose pyrophosphatase YjhB (NUDIX family)